MPSDALREALTRIVDKRTSMDDGFWISAREMRYAEEARACGMVPMDLLNEAAIRGTAQGLDVAAGIYRRSHQDDCRCEGCRAYDDPTFAAEYASLRSADAPEGGGS